MRLKTFVISLLLFSYLIFNPSIVSASTSTLYFLHTNHQGSITAVTDEQGNLVSQEGFYPYGSRLSEDRRQKITERGYTGQIKDASTSLYYYNARYYNQSLGIFTQPDQMGGGAKYAYANNNPLRFVDPSGNAAVADDTEKGGGGGVRNRCEADPGVNPLFCEGGQPPGILGTGFLMEYFTSPTPDEELILRTSTWDIYNKELDEIRPKKVEIMSRYLKQYAKTGLLSTNLGVKEAAIEAMKILLRTSEPRLLIHFVPENKVPFLGSGGAAGSLKISVRSWNSGPSVLVEEMFVPNNVPADYQFYIFFHEGNHVIYEISTNRTLYLLETGNYERYWDEVLAHSSTALLAKEVAQAKGTDLFGYYVPGDINTPEEVLSYHHAQGNAERLRHLYLKYLESHYGPAH